MPRTPRSSAPEQSVPDFDLSTAQDLVLAASAALEGFCELVREHQGTIEIDGQCICQLLRPQVDRLNVAADRISAAWDRYRHEEPVATA